MAKTMQGRGWSLSPEETMPSEPEPKKKGSPRPRIRLEKRRGKVVTVISGLHTCGSRKLQEMARELKQKCGAGGTVKDGVIELQGDRVRAAEVWLAKHRHP